MGKPPEKNKSDKNTIHSIFLDLSFPFMVKKTLDVIVWNTHTSKCLTVIGKVLVVNHKIVAADRSCLKSAALTEITQVCRKKKTKQPRPGNVKKNMFYYRHKSDRSFFYAPFPSYLDFISNFYLSSKDED